MKDQNSFWAKALCCACFFLVSFFCFWFWAASDKNEIAKLASLPEDSQEQIDFKLERIQAFLDQSPLDRCQLWKRRRQLEKRSEDERSSRYFAELFAKVSKEKNPFRAWLHLLAAKEKASSPEQKEKLQAQLVEIRQKAARLLRSHAGELSQLIQEKRFLEIARRLDPEMLRMLGEAWDFLPESENAKLWGAIQKEYQKIPYESPEKPAASFHPPPSDAHAPELNEFKEYIEKSRVWTRSRQYDLAQKCLEYVWQSLHSIENIDPENAAIVVVRQELKEIQAIKVFFSIAHEEAGQSIGVRKVFLLRSGKKIEGEIVRYAIGHFEINEIQGNESKGMVKVAMKDLDTEEIVSLALKSKQKRYLYEYAGIFCMHEKKPAQAFQLFSKALENGSNEREIKHYMAKLQHFR